MSKQIPLQRIKWIDLTKGVAIFLMVCGHTGIPSLISNWIWSFHMPLFFIISGMLFCPTKYTNIQKFIHRRIQTLIIPYITFSIIVLAASENRISDLWIFEGWMNGCALWFLPVLFMTEIYSFFIIQTCSTRKYIFIIAIFIGSIGYILPFYNVRLWYNLDVSFSASFFYLIGYLVRNELKQISSNLFLALLILCINIILSLLLPRTDMAINSCGWYGINAINALIGTVSIILLTKMVGGKIYRSHNFVSMFFLWAGKNTLIILGLSQIINISIKQYIYPFHNTLDSIIRHIVLWISLWVLSIIIKKYIPEVIGKSRN